MSRDRWHRSEHRARREDVAQPRRFRAGAAEPGIVELSETDDLPEAGAWVLLAFDADDVLTAVTLNENGARSPAPEHVLTLDAQAALQWALGWADGVNGAVYVRRA